MLVHVVYGFGISNAAIASCILPRASVVCTSLSCFSLLGTCVFYSALGAKGVAKSTYAGFETGDEFTGK